MKGRRTRALALVLAAWVLAALAATGAQPAGAVRLLADAGAACWHLFATIAPPVPAPQPPPNNFALSGLAALAPDDIWAVGSANVASSQALQTLTLHWDGRQWRTVFSLAPGGNAGLEAVAGSASDDVWAVGGAGILHWDGRAWSAVPAPAAGPLHGVAALTRQDAWAVGDTAVLHWSGAGWASVPAPGGQAIAARAADDIWVVGGAHIAHWDGASWGAVPVPALPGMELHAVTARAANDAWAVGLYQDGDLGATLTLHWDGAAWTQVPSPDPEQQPRGQHVAPLGASTVLRCCPAANATATVQNYLLGVTVAAPADAWAVGYQQVAWPNQIPDWWPILEHWDGHAWTLATGAVTGQALYQAIARAANGDLWVAGNLEQPAVLFTPLLMQRAVNCTAPPATPPRATPSPAPPPSATPPASRTFPETGKTVRSRFLAYWESHGGLAQQGYPISNEFTEISPLNGKPYTVQYFERGVFEYHPENAGTPFDVLLSQLGTFQYRKLYPQGAPNQVPNRADRGRYFPQTGHWLGGDFRAYWDSHGGLAQQGYPLSDEFTATSPLNGRPYTMQYFERAVFEYHPQNAGTPYLVLLAQLGTFQAQTKYPQGFPGP